MLHTDLALAARRARCIRLLSRWAANAHSTWVVWHIDNAATKVFTTAQWHGIC